MRLFKHYNQEILQLILMIMISFLLIMVSVTFIRYLALAADGDMPLKNAVAILGILLPNFIMLLLPVSLFLALVIGLNRLLHDNELLTGFACGISFYTLIGKLLRFALPLTLLAVILSYVIVPKMNEYQDHLSTIQSQDATLLNFVQSGRFFALGDNQIAYISNIDLNTRHSQNIFLYQNTGATTEIVLAPSGSIQTQGNKLAEASLNQGQEYLFSNAPHSLAVRMATFDRLVMTLLPDYDFSNTDLSAESTGSLWRHPNLINKLELQWRASTPLAILVLTILGAVLSDLSPRKSKVFKILYAIMIFIIYFNLLSVTKSLVLGGHFPLYPGLFAVHFLFLSIGLFLLAMREGHLNFIYRLRK